MSKAHGGYKTPGDYQKVKKGGIPTYLRNGREVYVDLLACGHAVQRQGTADYDTRRCPKCSEAVTGDVAPPMKNPVLPANPVAVTPVVNITHSLDTMRKSIEVMSTAISELVVKARKMDERLTQVEDMKTSPPPAPEGHGHD